MENTKKEDVAKRNATIVTEAVDAVMQILTLLPDQQRKALYLSFVEQKKQDEIAGVLGISRSTVAAHIRMGKANFRREFAAHYDVSLFGIKAAYGLEAA